MNNWLQRLKSAAMMEVKLLDHVIVTRDSYYSFADEGLLGLDGWNNKEQHLFSAIEHDFCY